MYHYNGGAWAAVGSGGGGFALPFEGSVNLGVPGFKVTNAGAGPAIQAITTNEFGYALQASNTTNYGYSVYAYSRSPNGIGVYALADSSIGIKGESGKGIGVDAISTDSTALRARIIKGSNTDPVILATHTGAGIAVDASSNTGAAIRGTSANAAGSIIATNTNAGAGIAIYGSSSGAGSTGVRGESQSGIGVLGYSNNGTGMSAGTLGGTGIYANSLSGTAISASSSSGYSLDISGKVKIAGGNTAPVAGAVLTSIDANGNAVWKERRVAFRATGVRASQNSISGGFKRVHYALEDFDYGGDFNVLLNDAPDANSSVFTAPVAGVYQFNSSSAVRGAANVDVGQTTMIIWRNRNGGLTQLAKVNGYDQYSSAIIDNVDEGNFSTSITVKLNAGDKIYVEV